MAHMGKGTDMVRAAGAAVNPTSGAPRMPSPSEVAQPHWNVKGDAGLPCGKNGDGMHREMMGKKY